MSADASSGWRHATHAERAALLSAMGEPPSSVEYLLRTPVPSEPLVGCRLTPDPDGTGFYSSDDEGPATPAPVAQNTGD